MFEDPVLPAELEPVDNHILFQFEDALDKARRNAFKETTEWGFEMRGDLDDSAKSSRWAIIIGLGPDAIEDEFFLGQRVLIENLMWTKLCEYKGVEFSRTDTTHIVAVEDDE